MPATGFKALWGCWRGRTDGGELLGDAGLVGQRLEVVEDAEDGPHVLAAAQRLQLLRALAAQLPAVLLPALELVHKLVHHVPQPAVGQLHQAPMPSRVWGDCFKPQTTHQVPRLSAANKLYAQAGQGP